MFLKQPRYTQGKERPQEEAGRSRWGGGVEKARGLPYQLCLGQPQDEEVHLHTSGQNLKKVTERPEPGSVTGTTQMVSVPSSLSLQCAFEVTLPPAWGSLGPHSELGGWDTTLLPPTFSASTRDPRSCNRSRQGWGAGSHDPTPGRREVDGDRTTHEPTLQAPVHAPLSSDFPNQIQEGPNRKEFQDGALRAQHSKSHTPRGSTVAVTLLLSPV